MVKSLVFLSAVVVAVVISKQIQSVESTPSLWNSVRITRDAPSASPEPEKDCSDSLKSMCKVDACPLDDTTNDKCCSCFSSCCSSEDDSPEEKRNSSISTSNKSNGNKTGEADTKEKFDQAVKKVEGFFKNVGHKVEKGVNTGWEKVKATAHSMKDSFLQGVNTGATWVKNQTTAGENSTTPCDGESCMESNDTTTASASNDRKESATMKREGENSSTSTMPSNGKRMYKRSPGNRRGNQEKGKKSDDSDSTEDSDEKSTEDTKAPSSSSENTNYKPSFNRQDKPEMPTKNMTQLQGRKNVTTPVPGMMKARKRRAALQSSTSYYATNTQVTPIKVTGGSSTNVTSSSSTSTGGKMDSSSSEEYTKPSYIRNMTVTSQRFRRDVPPGMIAERNKMREEDKAKMEGRMSSTPDSMKDTNSTSMMTPRNFQSRSADPAGPPANSMTMQTTTVRMPRCGSDPREVGERAGGDNDNSSRQKRAAPEKEKMAKENATDDPLSGNEESTTQASKSKKDEEKWGNKGTKIWITVEDKSTRITVNGTPEVPIKAPGSVDLEDIELISNQNQTISIGSPQIGNDAMIGFSAPVKTTGSGSPISAPASKPGRCRPLSQGLQCVTFGKDAAQCKDDSGCEGSKKCCFYSCKPTSDIGVCEHPIIS